MDRVRTTTLRKHLSYADGRQQFSHISDSEYSLQKMDGDHAVAKPRGDALPVVKYKEGTAQEMDETLGVEKIARTDRSVIRVQRDFSVRRSPNTSPHVPFGEV